MGGAEKNGGRVYSTMASFQSVTMGVAIIILILCLAGIGAIMYYAQIDSTFPPVPAMCPDYWEQKTKDNATWCGPPSQAIPGYKGNSECKNEFNLDRYAGKEGECEKRRLADRCGWTWSGITNLGDPCATAEE